MERPQGCQQRHHEPEYVLRPQFCRAPRVGQEGVGRDRGKWHDGPWEWWEELGHKAPEHHDSQKDQDCPHNCHDALHVIPP
jgi:hypothetical protein